ncbi:uncharacterized protein LOC129591585 [Paramacrobiotus metropolitanus]|uniref:uncharacterized protein LOC129591585 n=1 Tax=Paramacrobiotus metropolitanus TaxID=2943436 RepID=UPI002445FC2E|nr:uncharacterized protein LOC129591585 [Paramacrobiotus metropolitanus]
MDASTEKSDDNDNEPTRGHTVCRKIQPIYQYMWANFLLSALRFILECGLFGWTAYSLTVCAKERSPAKDNFLAWFFLVFAWYLLFTMASMSLCCLQISREVQRWRPGDVPESEVIADLETAYLPLLFMTLLNCGLLVLCWMGIGSAWKEIAGAWSCLSAEIPEAKTGRFMTLWTGLTAALIFTGCCVCYKSFV